MNARRCCTPSGSSGFGSSPKESAPWLAARWASMAAAPTAALVAALLWGVASDSAAGAVDDVVAGATAAASDAAASPASGHCSSNLRVLSHLQRARRSSRHARSAPGNASTMPLWRSVSRWGTDCQCCKCTVSGRTGSGSNRPWLFASSRLGSRRRCSWTCAGRPSSRWVREVGREAR